MHKKADITNRIWQYVQGTPDEELEAHLTSCPDCQDEYRALSGMMALRTAGEMPQVPESLSSTLTGLLSKVRPDLVTTPTTAPSIKQRLKTIVANLLQDTALQPQIAGLRGENRTRQIAFTSDVADLDLEVTPVEERFLIVGQLGMDEIPDHLNIRFVPADQDPLTDMTTVTQPSGQGHFRMNVAPGTWSIAVDIDDAVVVFPGIEL